jgi:hypothetical protein
MARKKDLPRPPRAATQSKRPANHCCPPTPKDDPNSWAYHRDFAQIILSKEENVALRVLETADIALSFARALVAKEYDRANAMLTAALKSSCQAEILKKKLEEMIQYSGDEDGWPTDVQVVTGADISDMDNWVGKNPEDFG